MFCSKCGTKNAENATFCNACGFQMQGEAPTAAPDPQPSAPIAAPAAFWTKQYAYIIAALCAILTIAWFVAPYLTTPLGSTFDVTFREVVTDPQFSKLRERNQFDFVIIPTIFMTLGVMGVLLNLVKPNNKKAKANAKGMIGVVTSVAGLGFTFFVHTIYTGPLAEWRGQSIVEAGPYFILAYLAYGASLILSIIAATHQKKSQ